MHTTVSRPFWTCQEIRDSLCTCFANTRWGGFVFKLFCLFEKQYPDLPLGWQEPNCLSRHSCLWVCIGGNVGQVSEVLSNSGKLVWDVNQLIFLKVYLFDSPLPQIQEEEKKLPKKEKLSRKEVCRNWQRGEGGQGIVGRNPGSEGSVVVSLELYGMHEICSLYINKNFKRKQKDLFIWLVELQRRER